MVAKILTLRLLKVTTVFREIKVVAASRYDLVITFTVENTIQVLSHFSSRR